MTERRRDDQLDREIRRFLAWQAEDVVDAPSAAEVARRIGSRTSRMPVWTRSRGELAWIVLTILLLGILAAGAVVSGLLPRRDVEVHRSYEAVFLRLEELGADIDVIVIAINARGDEREIAHLPTRSASSRFGAAGPNALLGSAAAVSSTGLLALPRTTGDYVFGWEIVDLRRPGAAPIVVPGIEQDYDVRTYDFGEPGTRRPVAVWGPGDRAAIFMYQRGDGSGVYRISMVDGRTGAGASMPHPEASILPYWALDGSGILAASSSLPSKRQVFRMDGSLADTVVGFANDGHGRRYRSDGAYSGTFADFDPGGYRDGSVELLLAAHQIELGDISWTADGQGQWVVRPGIDDRRLRLERWSGRATVTVATLRDDLAPPGSMDIGWLSGLAPDDSMLIIARERFTDISAEGYGVNPLAGREEIVVPGTGLRIDAAGYFAGWLEVPE